MNTAYLSIGANIGNREAYLREAIEKLSETPGVTFVEMSSIYETTPVGLTEQADFLNVVVRLNTTLSPHNLLAECQRIEAELGRVRTIRWGPRTADLDLLLYNNDNIETETLTVPHPRMRERAFVLIPLTELAPECRDPQTGNLYREELAVQKSGVRVWELVDESVRGHIVD